MAREHEVRVLFRAAAGPRVGFGHLVRCGVLARALGGACAVSLRGSAAAAHAARRRGWQMLAPSARSTRALVTFAPTLLVIDDPSARHAAVWVRAARRHGIPVATIHDLGLGRAGADVTIDGSLQLPRGIVPADLQGPEFAILDPDLAGWRERRPRREPNRVLIALGGGAHVRTLGPLLAARIRRAAPDARVDLAGGLLAPRGGSPLPPGCRWLATPEGLAPALATAAAAVVAGGVTLYEACALGTPVVTLAVVPAQRRTTHAFAAAGAAIDASGPVRGPALDRAAAGVSYLLSHPRAAARLSRRARHLVDAGGTRRVTRHLLALASRDRAEERHVA
jgi:spore coat polysaccharide biosynthesis predicted glycosyltransferase SpsG